MSDRNKTTSQLKRKRNGKKWTITKSIQEIGSLIIKRGSRTKISYLKDYLSETLSSAYSLHEELMLQLEEDDSDFSDIWIEELSVRVNTCFAEIDSYLKERENDSPSSITSAKTRQINKWREDTRRESTISDGSAELPLFHDEVGANQGDVTENAFIDITNAFSQIHIEKRESNSLKLPNLQNRSNVILRRSNSQPILSRRDDKDHAVPQQFVEFLPLENQSSARTTYFQDTSTIKRKSIANPKTQHDPKAVNITLNRRFSEISQSKTSDPVVDDNRSVDHGPQRTYLVNPTNHLSHVVGNKNVVSDKKGEPLGKVYRPAKNINQGVDDWIDHLDPISLGITSMEKSSNQIDVSTQLLIQQRLPRLILITFDGDPNSWVEFISKFYDLVHKQPFLDTFQKRTYLVQHLKGEALKSIGGFGNDNEGYVFSLKRLKYMFGNRTLVAEATIRKIAYGKQIPDSDPKALADFYYSVSSCINTLRKMNYTSDLYSSHVLRQTLSRLPNNLTTKWSEYSFRTRKFEEPNLEHLERWLQDRVMASKDPYLPWNKGKRISTLYTSERKEPTTHHCPCCKANHLLFKCEKYKNKPDNQKLSFVKSQRLCFNCLSSNHPVKECPSKKSCFKPDCKKRHHTSLHYALDPAISTSKSTDSSKTNAPISDVPSPTVGIMRNNRIVYLQIIPVRVSNRRGDSIHTFGLLDSGSQCTIITKSLCQKLKLPGRMEKIKFGTIKDDEVIPSKIVDLKISSMDDEFSMEIRNVYSIADQMFNVPGQNVPVNSESKWDYLRGIEFPEVRADQVEILIGADAPAALISKEVRCGEPGLPYASKTPLGWTLVGVYEDNPMASNLLKITHTKVDPCQDELHDLVKNFWETESFGTTVDFKFPISMEEREILKKLDNETSFVNGHYEVPMLWKENICLPENLPVANRRLSSSTKRFQKDENFFVMYEKNLKDYLQKGHARKLKKEEISIRTHKTWYLPHHGVTNINKPGKVRMVFDAASKSAGQSLNSNLRTGPDLVNSLVGVLIRFRKHRVAVTADIEGMFHQVRLKPPDTEAVRFLWKEDPNSEDPPAHYKMLVHIFGATDSPCCATYALRRAALDQKEIFSKSVVDTVLRNFYVDDLLKSVPYEEEAKDLIPNLDKLLKNRGFNLTKFSSNVKSVLSVVPPEKLTVEPSLKFEDNITRALGVKWDLREDCFLYSVDVQTESESKRCTKRQILKKTSTIFDPLGFLTPFTLIAKLILQDLWKEKIDWDVEVGEKIQTLWNHWLMELSKVSKIIRIPRSFNLQIDQKIQLHLFCDASERAFAAVAYLRIQQEKDVHCHLVMAKSRVAPIKTLTLPRLELQGAVLAVRLRETITKEIDYNIPTTYFWTDSMLNLQYINNEQKRFKVFVGNRVAEILEHSKRSQWRFVPGKSNPADLATRGTNVEETDPNSRWLNGPSFLLQDENSWPTTSNVQPLDSTDVEIRSNHVKLEESTLVSYDRFSSWKRLVRVIAWMGVFIHTPKPTHQQLVVEASCRHLTLEEEAIGRQILIKLIQQESFLLEIKNLKNKEPIPKGKLYNLDPFLDKDNILRVGGRLKRGEFPYAARHQIILSSKHPATVLLGWYLHRFHKHVGLEHLLSLTRQEYWIVGGRVMLKQIGRKCILCQKRKAKPTIIKMADLPEDRVSVSTPPFYYTGVDYFGPITVKILRSRTKRWGCIFTCLNTRAVHLEVAPSLQSGDFISVLNRFISRRGCPKSIRSDCGTNFKGASNELKLELERMDHQKIVESLERRDIDWKFNPPESPHMGGVWERMVQSVKKSLGIILMSEDVVLTDYTLMTVFTEVESLINSRPLTRVSDDVNDLEALTPNHFLIGRASSKLSPCVIYNSKMLPRQRWRQVHSVSQQFWDRWRREYLPTLTGRNKWVHGAKNVQVGDLVMVLDGTQVRSKWLLGRIVATLPSRDGCVRKVEVKTRNGQYVRPMVKIAPLELD